MCCATLCMFTFGRPESQPVGSRGYRSDFVSRGLIVLICPSRFLLASSLSPHGISPDRIQYPVGFLTPSPSSRARMGGANRTDCNPHLVFGSQSPTSGNRETNEKGQQGSDSRICSWKNRTLPTHSASWRFREEG